MRLPLATVSVLAWRNLWRNRRRTLIMLLTIAVGVWAMIFMNALMRGMTDQMVRNGLNLLPGEVQIHHPAYRQDPSVVNSIGPLPAALRAAIDASPVTGESARVRVPAVISSEYGSRSVTLLGVDPGEEEQVGARPDRIVQGRFLEGVDDRGIVIGAHLAEQLETRLGKRVVLMSQDPDNEVADRGFRVVGIYGARLRNTEDRFVFVGRATAQEMLRLGDQVSEIALTAEDYRAVDRWYPALAQAAGDGLAVASWTQLNAFLGTMLGVQDGFALIFIVVVFLALSFGLVNTLVMALFERVREIGLMMALGMRPGLIVLQVLLESLYLLTFGLLSGNLLAVLTVLPLESGIDVSAVAEGMEMMAMGTVLYPALDVRDMLMSTAVVIGLGLTASLLPAWRAAQLDPVRALARNL
jgi:ABC-type lipoprotein release transport system permease subunit